MLSAKISFTTDSSICRRSHTKVLSSFSNFLANSAGVISSNLLKRFKPSGERSISSGLAQTLGAGTLEAKIKPLRSKIRPRLAGSVRVLANLTSPWRLKKALSNT